MYFTFMLTDLRKIAKGNKRSRSEREKDISDDAISLLNELRELPVSFEPDASEIYRHLRHGSGGPLGRARIRLGLDDIPFNIPGRIWLDLAGDIGGGSPRDPSIMANYRVNW